MARSDQPILKLTIGDAEKIAGRELTDAEVARISNALDLSNDAIYNSFEDAVHRMIGNAD